MSQKFALPCPACDDATAVSAAQAGETIVCSCGQELTVPTLRKLQTLPFSASSEPAETRQPAWQLRHAALSAALCLAAVAGGIGGYLFTQRPVPPAKLDRQLLAQAAQQLETMPLEHTWHFWQHVLHREGLQAVPTMSEVAYVQALRAWRVQLGLAWGLAGLATATAGCLWLGKPRSA